MSDDAISRQAIDDYIVKLLSGYLYDEERTRLEELSAYLWELPSVNPQEPKWDRLYSWLNDMRYGIAPDETVTDIDERNVRTAQVVLLDEIMEWIEKHPQEPKTDSWSIKDVADTFKKHGLIVEQEPKTGHWIRQTDDYHDYYECEHCGIAVGLDDIKNYCPNCGCRMVEPQESEG